MAEKKPASKKQRSPLQKLLYFLSDKELVLKLEKAAICLPIKKGYVIFNQKDEGKSLHSGIAKSESDAWKLAAHNL